MRFDSLSEFMSMAGHGPYVWSAYAIAFVVLAMNVAWPLVQKRKNLDALREEMKRENVMLDQGKNE